MKNIIEKDNKLWMKYSLVMLPTNKSSSICTVKHFIDNKIKLLYNHNNKAFIFEEDKDLIIQPQHLYILSDEEIKEGDWYLSDKFVWQMKYPQWGEEGQGGAKKIIATTNPELTEIIECNGTSYVFKIPKIPQSFIQEFVKNQGNGYNKILIEVELGEDYLAGNSGGNEIWSSYPDKLKLSSNNEVNIIMENVDNWNLIHNRYLDYVVIHNKQVGVVNLIKWFKLNYNPPTKINK